MPMELLQQLSLSFNLYTRYDLFKVCLVPFKIYCRVREGERENNDRIPSLRGRQKERDVNKYKPIK